MVMIQVILMGENVLLLTHTGVYRISAVSKQSINDIKLSPVRNVCPNRLHFYTV